MIVLNTLASDAPSKRPTIRGLVLFDQAPDAVTHLIVRSLATDGPMLPTMVDELPQRAGWMHEPKRFEASGDRARAFPSGGGL